MPAVGAGVAPARPAARPTPIRQTATPVVRETYLWSHPLHFPLCPFSDYVGTLLVAGPAVSGTIIRSSPARRQGGRREGCGAGCRRSASMDAPPAPAAQQDLGFCRERLAACAHLRGRIYAINYKQTEPRGACRAGRSGVRGLVLPAWRRPRGGSRVKAHPRVGTGLARPLRRLLRCRRAAASRPS